MANLAAIWTRDMNTGSTAPNPKQRAIGEFRRRGGLLRFSEAMAIGIRRHTLRALLETGQIKRVGRGLYMMSEAPHAHPDLAMVATLAPKAVVCLISALAFHELTTQIPHEVHIAIARPCRLPRITYPPTRCFRFSGKAFTDGVEEHRIDGRSIRVYSAAKTVADSFKFRNKIGLDVAIEALRDWNRIRGRRVDELMHYAEVCRVAKVMRPYLEAIMA